MRVGRSTTVHFVSQVLLSVSGFLATFLIARLLGGEVLGVYAVAVATVFWLNVPGNAISNAVTKRLSEDPGDEGLFTAGLLIAVALGALLAAAVVIMAPAVRPLVDPSVRPLFSSFTRWLLGLLVFSNVVFVIGVGGLAGRKRVGRSGLLKAGERVLRTGLQVAAILLGSGLVGLLAGHVFAMALSAVVGILMVARRFDPPTRDHVASLLEYARYAWLGTLKTRSLGWMDTIVLALFVDSLLIGIYEVSWNLASMFALAALSIRRTLFPEISDLSTDARFERVQHFLNEGLTYTGVLLVPGLFGALAVGDRVLKIYRPEFQQGATVLAILVFARLAAAYGNQFVNAINAMDRPDIAFRINAAFIVVNLGSNVGLVWRFGWIGAAVATTLSSFLVLVLGYRGFTDLLARPDVPYGEFGRQVFAGAVMWGVVAALRPLVPESHQVTILLIGFGAAVYAGTLLLVSTRVRRKTVALALEVT